MHPQLLTIAIINLFFVLWLIAIHALYYPLFVLGFKLKKMQYTPSIKLFYHQLFIAINKEKITISLIRHFDTYKVRIKFPYPTSFLATLSQNCKKQSEYFIFAGGNLFLTAPDDQTLAYFYTKRNLFQTLAAKHSPTFADHQIEKIYFTPYSISIELRTKSLETLIYDLPDLNGYSKEIAELVSLSERNEHRALLEKNRLISNKVLIATLLITVITFAVIGISASTLNIKLHQIPPQKKDTYIQVWLINKDFAHVYDITEENQKPELLAKNLVDLHEYAGFKPELVPWGFRVSPKYNYRHHYKILIFPKLTEILGFINLTPIKQMTCGEYMLLIYDLSDIKAKGYINIYMHYRGEMPLININQLLPRLDEVVYQQESPTYNMLCTELMTSVAIDTGNNNVR